MITNRSRTSRARRPFDDTPLAKGLEAEREQPIEQSFNTKAPTAMDPWAPYVPSDEAR
jgi:hypothetical protein